MHAARVGCSGEANQFRLFLHVGAYWLLHTGKRCRSARLGGATFDTIRRTFVKAVRFEELKGRLELCLDRRPGGNTNGRCYRELLLFEAVAIERKIGISIDYWR